MIIVQPSPSSDDDDSPFEEYAISSPDDQATSGKPSGRFQWVVEKNAAVAERTVKQTRWGTAIFKGMHILYISNH